MKNNQTAVEWLVEKLPIRIINAYREEIEEANAMQKEQIVTAHLTGLIHSLEMEASKQAEQYYNETYGGKG